jgi:hypothetical protein
MRNLRCRYWSALTKRSRRKTVFAFSAASLFVIEIAVSSVDTVLDAHIALENEARLAPQTDPPGSQNCTVSRVIDTPFPNADKAVYACSASFILSVRAEESPNALTIAEDCAYFTETTLV